MGDHSTDKGGRNSNTGYTGRNISTKKQNVAEMRENYWDYEKEWKEEQGAFTYYGFSSRDGQEAWVYEIAVDTSQSYSTLEVPELLGNKKVTCIGYTEKKDPIAFVDCPRLKKLTLSSKNKVYRIKDLCIITKKDQALIYTLSREDTLKIPSGVKLIKEYALSNCVSKVVELPASVKKIEARAFNRDYRHQNKKIKNVTISKKNKVYAKDGQCIYNKKEQTLAVAIPDDKGVLYISDKVKYLTESYSLVNCNVYEKYLEKVVLPKKLKSVTVAGFYSLDESKSVYFMGKNPPKVKKKIKGMSSLPVFTKIYVSKASYDKYRQWYKKHDCLDSIGKIYQF